MEQSSIVERNSGKSGSFRLGLGSTVTNEAKVHTVVELGSVVDDFTHQSESLLHAGVVDGVDVDVHQEQQQHEQQQQQQHRSHLSFRQMRSLVALCDTLLPSINTNTNNIVVASQDQDVVSTFYKTSASMAGTPHRLGVLISEKLKHPSRWLLRMTLWLLSTWFGTFILCGLACLSTKFPFFHCFPDLPFQTRQQIMQSWSLSPLPLHRMFFRSIKLLTVLVFFTQVDESEDNLTWKAIGYSGPDPEFKEQLKNQFLHRASKEEAQEQQMEEEDDDGEEEVMGPLYKGLVHLNYPRDTIADSLRRFGFPVKVNPRKTKPCSISSPSLVIHCDAVVVGSGSGGGVVAGVLAKAGYKVLVLEKGNYSARSNLSLLEGPSMDQMYLANGLLATQDMSVLILAGSTVGGGSQINWSASIKTPQHVCKEWCEKHELELFESELYKEALDAVCEKMGVQSEVEEEGFNNAVLRKGCQEMGYPVSNIPRNATQDHYCGWCCFGCKDGKKKGTSETWLVDLVKSGNGAILPGCEAIQVLQRKKKGGERRIAKGVAFAIDYKGTKDICVVESKVTIVACGALSTPELLKRSGLNNANIGRNLHLHPVTMAWGYFPDEQPPQPPQPPQLPQLPQLPSSTHVWPEKHKKSYEGGIMTAMSTVAADFDKSGYGAVIQTPALHPGMFSILMPWVSGKDMKDRMRKYSRTAHVFALARDKGSGTVDSPNSISYQMGDVDTKSLNKGMEKVLRLLAAAGAEEIGTHHNKGRSLKVKEVSYHEFEKFVKEESSRPLNDLATPICSAHQMGSCRMGNNPEESVVNQMGETWEVEGLYLSDTSVFPTALGVNPMVTVQAIAYCTAQSVLQVLRRKRTK